MVGLRDGTNDGWLGVLDGCLVGCDGLADGVSVGNVCPEVGRLDGELGSSVLGRSDGWTLGFMELGCSVLGMGDGDWVLSGKRTT